MTTFTLILLTALLAWQVACVVQETIQPGSEGAANSRPHVDSFCHLSPRNPRCEPTGFA